MRTPSIEKLRMHAISRSLFPPTTLESAIDQMGFVQADPIRAPARAQDLILRHRVKGYCAGDLERRYPDLHVEEDYLYAYGFLPHAVWRLLHPRERTGLSPLEKKVLAIVRRYGRMHPRELEAHLGRARVINAWGGYSKATTSALEDLHYRGLLRIAGRDKGIRIYECAQSTDQSPSEERLRKIILVVATILAPVPLKTLQANCARFKRLGSIQTALEHLLRTGQLEKDTIEGLTYVWPPVRLADEYLMNTVRFLAPFDPLVWDRRRFEHLWQWSYRFEAYTPPAKRVRGYYAMPLLWRNRVIGWANVSAAGRELKVDVGFVESRPRERMFRSELDAEIARMETFLG
jgi:uncharacterized protein YcaQ